MRIALIIPTYNEAGGIGTVLQDLEAVFASYPLHAWLVVVVDANSPDGTGDVVQAYAKHYQNIHLVTEKEKGGIGAAYSSGFLYGMKTLDADVLISFDGDGQHDPHDIPRLVAEIEGGYDYVVGSRYVKGGSVPKEWAPHRKILSRFGSLYARLLLELPLYDVTSGFRAMRVRGFAERLPFTREKMISRQYAYIFQFSYEMMQLGARIKEIPIDFRLRENDSSKSTPRDIIESLRVTGILRLQNLRHWRLLRVLLIGGIGFVLQTTFFEIVGIELGLLLPSTATIIGGEIAIISNFFLNERFSFHDRVASATSFMRRMARFHLVALGSVAIQWLLVRGTEYTLGLSPIPLRVAYVLGVVLGILVTYAGYYFWVWRAEK
jgi:dolichol-phosphate mannosyltransferase